METGERRRAKEKERERDCTAYSFEYNTSPAAADSVFALFPRSEGTNERTKDRKTTLTTTQHNYCSFLPPPNSGDVLVGLVHTNLKFREHVIGEDEVWIQ